MMRSGLVGLALAALAIALPAWAETTKTTTTVASGETLHAIEAGNGRPVVFLHGLPSSSLLWRNVVPEVGKVAHAIAPDLPGYGLSSAPLSGGRGLDALSPVLDTYLDQVSDDKIVLVVNDVGSLLGLNYAVRNPDRIAGLVLVEAVFLPPQEFMAQIGPDQMQFLQMMNSDPAFVSSITVDQPAIVEMALQANTMSELDQDTLSAYVAPYLATAPDHMARREVLAATFGEIGAPLFGRFAAENAAGLQTLDVPVLLLAAKPGYIVSDQAIDAARGIFTDLTVVEIPEALHFVAEDQPQAVGDAIVDWLNTVD